ncbi:hypothetical protein [Clostridium algidicarnis]|uniref:hypothetical protein n=1 Tax=Clostridium algidicarnis TaxID=37659 RepID=UPI0016266F82|nr:hypothetical protein [Clostridium algidicarnis]MBB6630443.1 hypothetical protein [Clostridium algidicarnis]
MNILKVEVFLDDNVPEYMLEIIRCLSVISYDENDNGTNHQELIDNTEYQSILELKKDIAKRLDVDTSIIEICL